MDFNYNLQEIEMRNRLRISTPSSVLLDVCLGPSPPLISDDTTAPTKTTFPMSLSGSVSTITTSTTLAAARARRPPQESSSTTAEQFQTSIHLRRSCPLQLRVNIGTVAAMVAATLIQAHTRQTAKSRFPRRRLSRTQSPTFHPTPT